MSFSEKRAAFLWVRSALLCAVSVAALSASVIKAKAAGSETIALPDVVVDGTHASAEAKAFDRFETARKEMLPSIGATSYTVTREAIEASPQGDDTPFDRLLLQAPGVAADSAASHPDFHIRNEYANAQYRINGILLPDGVTELGPILDTSFVGTLSLLTGTLPAQYGLRTAGVVDITSRLPTTPGGSVSIYGGSHGTIAPSFNYGGLSGDTQYFVALRGFQSNVGIENSTPSFEPIHDRTDQIKGFGYMSKLLSDSARLSVMAGVSVSQFQIPNNPNQTPLGDFGGTSFSSANLNERETDRSTFGIIALQTNSAKLDTQLSFVTRAAQVHFVPDIGGDLAFNDVASDVSRKSLLNGIQGDAAYRLDERQTIRAGFGLTVEQTYNDNILTALPLDPAGVPLPTPVTIVDNERKLGINAGGYVQDEIKLNPFWTLNVGLRFDQLYQYVTTNQLSPRLALVYKPDDATTVHIGYARYFTPPNQSEGATPNIALARGTTLEPEVGIADPVRPERSHYFDVGAERMVLPGLNVGVDAYLKLVTDLIDDGQFGEAQVLSQLNYARGTSEGLEFKAKYTHDGFTAYGNLSTNRTKDTRPSSNQYVLDADEYAYIASHAIFADDVQLVTASAGVSYKMGKTTLAADLIYGSGLRSDFANLGHVPAYTQVNLGVSQQLASFDGKPLTARFDIVNAFDTIYQIRDGSGIGVFAPQYGPRRGFYFGLTKAL